MIWAWRASNSNCPHGLALLAASKALDPDDCNRVQGGGNEIEPDKQFVVLYRLTKARELAIMTCNSGGSYVESRLFFVTGPTRSKVAPVKLGIFNADRHSIEPTLAIPAAEYEPARRQLASDTPYNSEQTCGAHQVWSWTGHAFALREIDAWTKCDTPSPAGADAWPPVWRQGRWVKS